MNKLTIVLLLLCCTPVEAGEFWTDDNIANGLMVSSNVLYVADWAQTREIADNPDFYEKEWASKFIGENPTTKDVNQYFIASIVLYNTINYFLPTKWKKWYSGSATAFQLIIVKDNIGLGINMKF